ncbi:penicillin-binding protein activator [Erythrobacter sp. W53]|uniref:penicillin-binding protein activator n=1 Tax=Erythrobacter sp. W53 TaxID=3425947 RepID=UPI003D76A312
MGLAIDGKLSLGAIFNRRTFAASALAVLLAGCAVVPKGADVPTTTVDPNPEPSATALPTDQTRHRIALLVPTSGNNGAVGQSIANATTMALLDTNASNLRITTYDTGASARDAARRAIADGNKLILGPLMGSNVANVASIARPANVPLIAFSNDTRVAAADVFVMGHIPEQSIARSVEYARGQGARNFAILAPNGEYGRRAEAAMRSSVARYGGQVSEVERYARGNTSIISAAQRLQERGGFDSVLIPEGAQLATRAAGQIRPGGSGNTRIIGTELWSGENAVTRASALRGAVFSAVSDNRYRRFVTSYEGRFGGQPYRLATLGYDSVLLALRVAQDWRIGSDFPVSRLRDDGGFLGLDGAFRFQRNGVVERAMEVRQIRQGEVSIVDAAPRRFGN